MANDYQDPRSAILSGLREIGLSHSGSLAVIEEHDRKVSAAAIREAARVLRAEDGTDDRWYADLLGVHANNIEKGGA